MRRWLILRGAQYRVFEADYTRHVVRLSVSLVNETAYFTLRKIRINTSIILAWRRAAVSLRGHSCYYWVHL